LIVLDTSLLYALLDRRDRRHEEAASWYRGAEDDLVTSPLVLAEVDYLVGRIGGVALTAFRRDVAAGAYLVDWWTGIVETMVELAGRYRELGVSLADTSLVALAERHGTHRVATFDERHFRAMQPLGTEVAFELLPADVR
jgi:predicted nucleic acid-binding protein